MWGFCETNLSTQNPHFLAAQELQAGKGSIRGLETGQASQIAVVISLDLHGNTDNLGT